MTTLEYIPLSEFTRSSLPASAVSSPDNEAALNTIQTLQTLITSAAQARMKLDPSSYTLLVSSQNISQLSSSHKGVQEDISNTKRLSQAARKCAPVYACSSVLAGHASEGDEYADIGIWIDSQELDIGHESKDADPDLEQVSAHSTFKIKPLPLSPDTHTPTTFVLPTPPIPDFSNALSELTSLLSSNLYNNSGVLDDNHEHGPNLPLSFTVKKNETDELCFYFILGRAQGRALPNHNNDDDDDGSTAHSCASWIGLIGIGVES